MKQAPLSEVKDDLSKFLHVAEKEAVVITRHGKPAGVLIGFASEEDWIDYRIEHDPKFFERINRARQSIQEGKGVALSDYKKKLSVGSTE
jgi:prevent-host-death family protein